MSKKNISESEKIDKFLSNNKNMEGIIDITSKNFEELNTIEEKYNQKILEIVEIFSKYDINISESRAKRIFEFVEKIKQEYTTIDSNNSNNNNKISDNELENISGGAKNTSSDMLYDTRCAISMAFGII